MRTLAHNTYVAPSVETITALWHFHLLAAVDLLPFVDDFHPERNFVLNRKAFISMLPCSPCLSFDSLSNMVYELLKDCFVLNNCTSGFDFFFEICGHIVCGNVPPLVSHLLVASQLFTLEK